MQSVQPFELIEPTDGYAMTSAFVDKDGSVVFEPVVAAKDDGRRGTLQDRQSFRSSVLFVVAVLRFCQRCVRGVLQELHEAFEGDRERRAAMHLVGADTVHGCSQLGFLQKRRSHDRCKSGARRCHQCSDFCNFANRHIQACQHCTEEACAQARLPPDALPANDSACGLQAEECEEQLVHTRVRRLHNEEVDVESAATAPVPQRFAYSPTGVVQEF